jgi:hypothetical protein
MRRRGDEQVIVTNVRNVAVESDLYTVETTEGPTDEIEQALADLEGPLNDALDGLVAGHIPGLNSTHRTYLSDFMAIQFVRTPENLDRLLFPLLAAEHAGESPISDTAMSRYLQERHLGFTPEDAEVAAACDFANYALSQGIPDKQSLLRMKFQIASAQIAPRLQAMRWSLERCSKPRLIATDRPLALWRPPAESNRFDGIGIENAQEIRFPVSPRDVLVLRHSGHDEVLSVPPHRGSEVSDHLARQCHRLVIAPTDRTHFLKTMALAARRPAMRFNTGPLIETRADGSVHERGEVIHTWVPDSD